MDDAPLESALLIPIPAAEPVVAAQRDRYDQAARDGIPAHLTVAYPFKVELTGADTAALTAIFAATPPFDVALVATAWFADRVLYLRPADPRPIIAIQQAIDADFPDYPIYGGQHTDYVPHLTVGDDGEIEALREAERVVTPSLPIHQHVTEVQRWVGPRPSGTPQSWRLVQRFPLG